jgi:hypothetical protein
MKTINSGKRNTRTAGPQKEAVIRKNQQAASGAAITALVKGSRRRKREKPELTTEGFRHCVAESLFFDSERERRQAFEKKVSMRQLLFWCNSAVTAVRMAFECLILGVLGKGKRTSRDKLISDGFLLEATGCEIWPLGPLNPPVLFKQILNGKGKPTGQYFLGPHRGEGLIVAVAGETDDLPGSAFHNQVPFIALCAVLKEADQKIARKIDGALDTKERLNTFLEFCRQRLANETKTSESCLKAIGWTIGRSFGNNDYRVKELVSTLTEAPLPICLLSWEKVQHGVFLRCDYKMALTCFTATRKRTPAGQDMFQSQWIDKLFRPNIGDKHYRNLSRIIDSQERGPDLKRAAH